MSVLGGFDQRFRGFRVIEIGGVGVLLALILLVYLAKTIAGSESAEIDHVQQQIGDQRARVTLLRAEPNRGAESGDEATSYSLPSTEAGQPASKAAVSGG